MWIDTHCHLDADEFDRDRDDVVARAREAGVGMLVIPTGVVDECDEVRAIAHRHGFAYALGMHPLWLVDAVEDDVERLRDAVQASLADPRFVAVGMFCGLIPGPLQMLGAGIACVLFRVNLPVSLVTTFYTNPLTIVPLYLVAYQIGSFVLGASGSKPVTRPPDWNWSQPFGSAEAIGQWMIGLGPPLALGVLLLACLLSLLGYLIVRGLWSVHLRRAWNARRRRTSPARSDQAG
jgi:uncharacterized protein (DUF2062 family)